MIYLMTAFFLRQANAGWPWWTAFWLLLVGSYGVQVATFFLSTYQIIYL